MPDVAQLAPRLQAFFNKQADEAARQTQFVQRASKLSGPLFLQTLVFGFMEAPEASLVDLIETANDLGVDITKQGLHERIQRAVPFLKQMFQDSLELFRNDWPLEIAVLNQFSGIFVTDSTVIGLPACLQAEFPGCGGDGPEAALKIQLTVELLYGLIGRLDMEAGRSPDQAYTGHLDNVQAGALYLFDLGYFVLRHFQDIQAQNAYFLSRLDTQTALFEPETGQPVDLLAWLRAQTDNHFEADWLMGAKEKLPCRVLGVRVPQEVADRRRQKARKNAQRKGRTPSARYLELLAWNLYVTNVPATMLTWEHILVLYPVRWQIELIFKLWKSQCQLDRVAGQHRQRILCELYAKMIGIVVTQCLLAPWRWGQRELSAGKAQRLLRHYAVRLAQSLGSVESLTQMLHQIIARCLKQALKDKRQKRLSTFQKLDRLIEKHTLILDPTITAVLFRPQLMGVLA